MSWSELERFVADAERSESVRRQLQTCRSQADLVLQARRLGYRVTRVDLQTAWQRHQQRTPGVGASGLA